MNRELILSQHSIGGATGLEPATFRVRGGGAVVVVINSDRCGVFGTYWDGTVLVAEACDHPNCLVLRFSFPMDRVAA
jgi:hypothetical protein